MSAIDCDGCGDQVQLEELGYVVEQGENHDGNHEPSGLEQPPKNSGAERNE